MVKTAQLLRSLFLILITIIQFLRLAVSSRAALSAEVLFLRKQLTFYQEHQVQLRQLTDAARVGLVFWSQWFDWRSALAIIQPETLIGWHRKGFKLFWRRKSKMGRPRLSEKIRQLIVRMVKENPTWGQERVGAELSLKLGIRVSPRTIRAYWPSGCHPTRKRTRFATLGDLRPEPRKVDCGLRFSGIDCGQLSSALCPGGDGSGKPSDSAF